MRHGPKPSWLSTDPRHSVFASDLDRDGDLDLLSVADQVLAWHRNDGGAPPAFVANVIASDLVGGHWVVAVDMDGDGDQDPVVADTKANAIYWYETMLSQPGGQPSFLRHLVSTATQGPRTVDAADLDRDGDLDLYVAADLDNGVTWFENLGDKPLNFARHVVTDSALDARAAYAADIDGDGDLDLMSVSAADSQVAWYENNGARPPQFIPHTISRAMFGARTIAAADLDGDGDIDILTAAEYGHSIVWFENLGGSPPAFAANTIATNAWGVNALFAGDADQDGDVDLFAASAASNSILWHENNGAGDPAFAEHVLSFYSADAHGVFAADMDGDGDLDVLAASRGDGKIAWYENLGGQYLLTTLADELLNGNLQTVLRLLVTHRGWPNDPQLALHRLVLRFTDAAGQPLTTPRLASLVRRLSIYRDQGDGLFSPSQDPLLVAPGELVLDNTGALVIPIMSQDPNTQMVPRTTTQFFAVIEWWLDGCSELEGPQVAVVPEFIRVQNVLTNYPVAAEYVRNLDGVAELAVQPTVVINELVAKNVSGLLDPDEVGEYPDWIELYNPTAAAIHLGGMAFTDDPNNLLRYRIPDGVTIGAHSFLIFVADGEPEQGPLHTNFKLNRSSEFVGFYAPTAQGLRPLDAIEYGPLLPDEAYGRDPANPDNWQLLGTATPGSINLTVPVSARIYLPTVMHTAACR